MAFLSVKNDVNVSSKSNKQKNLRKKIFVDIWKVTDEEQDPDPLVRGTDPRIPNPYQNVTDPDHCLSDIYISRHRSKTIN